MPRTIKSGETVNQLLPLHVITVSHNPRKPLKKLQEMGFDPMKFCHDFGLSDDPEKRSHFVQTLRENHPEIERMAESFADRTQIQPIVVRDFRVKTPTGYVVRYGIACGERRYIACVFRQASSGVPCPVKAVVKKMTVEEAYWMGVEENLIREDMTEVEKGEIFARYAEENAVDGEPLPWTEVAKHFHCEYHYVRGRAALARKLPQERMQLYLDGKLNLTDAIREALGEQTAEKSKPPKEHRRNPLEERFDATPRDKLERLETLAEVMKLDLATALSESDSRLQNKEEAEARATEREVKGRKPTESASA